ncbi:NUDIX domain-containing protein [Sphingosinicella rhizophila]|uniref:NUDIX domain-containing protein n=1 Tax=Sphingosinicella rhizophila TaxID=3050082 RepID=A0ABU3Q420_9SPHN|nr:NUDIX domain-containing protein [Sphingosinicella sp. GR2756]MDT9598158.1 NUDIX domain-containing protein [Sphingosinicella sp. GR2756]
MTDFPEPIPAATLVLMRPSASGPPDLLVIERAANMAFAAGALAFPGGRIDPDDHASAALHGAGLADAAARVAAIRETIEETGIAVGIRQQPDPDQAASLRNGLAAGEAFSRLLDQHRLSLDLEALVPFARWCPNFRETRRFDTHFYIAEAPAGAPLVSADETEAARAFWSSAAAVLMEIEAGEARAIFPTRRNLERLARFASIDDARADAALHPVQKITPWVEERDGRHWVCIPEEAGYPVTAELFETARRR